jgi:hypothetical protein
LANGGAFHDQIRQLGNLIAQFDQFPDSPQKAACVELVQLLLDLHGTGLERAMEIVFEGGTQGPSIVDTLAKDAIVSSLLVLYSLHPDDLETRVRRAVEHMRPRLRKLACSAEVVGLNDGLAQLQVTTSGHGCGSSTKEVRAIVEEGVYELAPDIAALEILGLEEPSSTGFVALESLLGRSFVQASSQGHPLQAGGAE